MSEATRDATSQPYSGFDRMPIGGDWRVGKADRTLKDFDPYTGQVILEIPQCIRADLDTAYECAARTQVAWGQALPGMRATVMLRASEILKSRRHEVISWLIRESGSTRLKATLEYEATHAVMVWAASAPYLAEGSELPTDIPGKEGRAVRKPVGVVGVISPWNWPLHLSNRTLAPALAVGNTAVVKPASDTPITGGLLLAKIYEEAGLPPGVLNVVIGPGSEIGDAFVTHPVPRVISFTGSTPVGRHIAELAAKSPILKRVELELGGNGPFVVLEDADIEQTLEAAVFGKFLHQGQICIAVNRFIVDDRIHDDFVQRFVERVRALKVGNPDEPDTFIGPIINETQLKGLLERIEEARASGARQLFGGGPDGLVLPPHVFDDVTNSMPLAQNEIFGPIAPFIRVHGDAEALEIANATQHGLAGAVFTRDLERGEQFARQLEIGMVHVNDQPVIDLPNSPFGGEKNSGLGRFNGRWAIDAFTADQWLTVQHTPHHLPFDARQVTGAWAA
ncbi:MAG: aldehyde dehydrogenase [Rhodospirillales bacterium]|nr:aldehyde dehydrogenase [Rhodospirillales bacterium]